MQKSRYVQIPEVITIHLGDKDADAPNITMPFAEYVKGCASCIICPTWPENAQRANIYAITSFALYRVCNKWYRARGYAFDITTSEEDLPFNGQGCLFYNTSCLVEELFNNYLTRQGSGDPLPAQICQSCQASGVSGALCQLGAIEMAENGNTVYDILRKYYGEDIVMVQNVPQKGGRERFLGTPLMCGAVGDDICTIKRELNCIGQNYPAIKPLDDDCPNFDAPCERAVRTFQYIFDLPITGVLDKATWYKIKQTSADIAQGDADPFAQKSVANLKPASGSVLAGNTVGNNPIFDSNERGDAVQKGVVSSSGMPNIVVPSRTIPGATSSTIIVPGDMTVNPVISDRGIAEKAAQDYRPPAHTALENVAEWNAIRESIMQSENPPDSIISDRGIAARAESESAIPEEAIPGIMPEEVVQSENPPDSIISDRGIAARAESESAIPGEAIPGIMPEEVVQSEIPSDSIISDRGIAARAESESAIPGETTPGVMPESIAYSKTAQGEAVQWNAARQNIPSESIIPESPVTAPKSPTDHLVKIGPSVSTALPDEGGVSSGHAVEWLKKYYGL
ncbi:peptidoglycan-binding domain-containing protein [Oscillospiraceae bacterium LTW-04]|nr:peptidoglycan-binding domain-containing protein [Oscillospiraceae bacterium MB24-C1]